MKPSKNLYFTLFSLLLSVLATVLLLEGLLRGWYFFHNRMDPPLSYLVEDLGWRPASNLKKTSSRKGYGEIRFSSTRDGFRRYGNTESEVPRVMVIGDSFTQAYHVSDGKAYFDYLAEPPAGIEVFAFGAGGYGTVQQALILDQYIPEIGPAMLVWQFTGNDFINNDWMLESHSPENSSHMRRPYYEGGAIVYRHPDGTLGLLAEYSLLIRRLLVIRGSYQKRTHGSIEDKLSLQNPNLQRSILTTRTIVNQISEKYPQLKIFAFFAGKQYYPWELAAFAQVCELPKLHCIEEIPNTLTEAAANGVQIDGGKDGHWNENGHRLAGLALRDAITSSH